MIKRFLLTSTQATHIQGKRRFPPVLSVRSQTLIYNHRYFENFTETTKQQYLSIL